MRGYSRDIVDHMTKLLHTLQQRPQQSYTFPCYRLVSQKSHWRWAFSFFCISQHLAHASCLLVWNHLSLTLISGPPKRFIYSEDILSTDTLCHFQVITKVWSKWPLSLSTLLFLVWLAQDTGTLRMMRFICMSSKKKMKKNPDSCYLKFPIIIWRCLNVCHY